jgi:ATP-dependent Clp protease ATP-binding subunit ClpX
MSGAGDESPPGPAWLESIRCSFCGKRGTEVGRIIAGPTPAVAICSECVVLCAQIVAEDGGPPAPSGPPDPAA